MVDDGEIGREKGRKIGGRVGWERERGFRGRARL
jgi:hypothetical protein